MPVQKLQPSFNLEQDRIEMLKQLIPEAVSDGKIDWDVLKESLGEYLEDEGADVEHFGLSWAGKREARRLASIPSKGTLVPVLGEGIDEDTTGNIFIEGDNLEVLKLLQKSYAGRVKLIYIDPPYNTGNDFIYKDDFSEPTADYLRKTGQADEHGNLLTSNPKSSGRFHSNWLNMMYPRLRLARNLLRDDGVVFISIDDIEVNNLRLLMSEVFGDENFIASICWQKKYAPANDTVDFSASHDFIVVYGKQRLLSDTGKPVALLNRMGRTEDNNKLYRNHDNDSRGLWRADNYLCNKTAEQRPNLYYPITHPKTSEQIYPNRTAVWRYSKERHEQNVKDNRVWWGLNNDNRVPAYKRFLSEVGGIVAETWWSHEEVGHNDEAKKQIKNLFSETSQVFDTPKPTRLIKRILSLATTSDTDDIILDFFAGSSTTAHAILELNTEDNGNRRFIMVQIPDKTTNEQYPTIAEISKERIRRVIKKIKDEQAEKLDLSKDDPQDLGFKVYKLDRSNLKIWKDYEGEDIQAVEQLLLDYQNPLGENLSEEKVVTELQLLEGFPLDSKIEQADTFVKNKVLCVTSEHIGHRLFICLDSKLDITTVQDVRLLEDEDIFICLDNALTDQEKMMLADGCNVKTI